MAAWEDYRSCCRATAGGDRAAVFCPDCGHKLFRCPAPDCGSLLTPLGHCSACVDLGLSIEKGAVLKARVGECLTVPFVLRNNSPARSLSVSSVLRGTANVPLETVPIAWERLEAGRTRAFSAVAGPFARGGLDSLRLTVVVTAALGDIEETYAFSGDVAIDVAGADPTQVVQTFNLAGADFGTAGMVVANPHASSESRSRQDGSLGARTSLALERAERFEIEHGLRGYEALAARIPRDVEFLFVGFPEADRPPDGPLLPFPVLRCGRNGRSRNAGSSTQPNDLCLRIYDSRSGALERDVSAGISRHVCDFVLQDDRLHVRAVGGNGLSVNAERLGAGERRVVRDGDSFAVAGAQGRALVFGVSVRASGSLVTRVRFEKAS